MTEIYEGPPMHVHIVSSDVARPKKRQKRTVFSTVVLTSDEAVKPILPQSDLRVCAYVQAIDNDIILTNSFAEGQSGANTASNVPFPSGTLIPGSNSLSSSRVSVNASGSATAPAAGATIASVSLAPGTWTINMVVLPSGTLAAGDNNNIKLVNTTSAATIISPLILDATTANAPVNEAPVTITLTATSTIAVQAIANAGVSAIYTVMLTATPVVSLMPSPPYRIDTNEAVFAAATTKATNSRVAVSATYYVEN